MVVRMRETQKRRSIAQIRQRQEPLIIESIAAMLDSRYRWLKKDLRNGGNLRHQLQKVMRSTNSLRKADEQENWKAWNRAFTKQMGEIFKPYINAVAGVENQYYVSHGYQPRPLDADVVLDTYVKWMTNSKWAAKDKSFAQLALDTENNSAKLIADWFRTDAPITKLFADLAPLFGKARAELIARTEATGLTSKIAQIHYAQLHIELFNVDLGDEVGPWPCGICTGKADQNPHSVWDEMPPFHPDCRCGTTPANADGSDLVYGQEPGVADDEQEEAPNFDDFAPIGQHEPVFDEFPNEQAVVDVPNEDVPELPEAKMPPLEEAIQQELSSKSATELASDQAIANAEAKHSTDPHFYEKIHDNPAEGYVGADGYRHFLGVENDDIQSYLKGISKGQFKNLTEDQSAAVESYTGSGFKGMNGLLRGKDIPGNPEVYQRAIDNVQSAVMAQSLEEGVTTWRAMGKHGDALHVEPGDIIQDKAFVSTAVDFDVAYNGLSYGFAGGDHKSNTMLQVDIPAGSHALAVHKITSMRGETEILLPYGAQMVVKSVEVTLSGIRIIHVEIVQQ